MSKITFNIEYAGLQLTIGKNERGEDVTPLKPISDLFGLQWERQRKKITNSPHLSKYLGVCTVQMYGAGGQKREFLCIKVDRVAAFLMSLSPDAVRSQGNVSAADFLEQKLNEWADALHDYEEIGIAINLSHAKAQDALRRSCLTVGSLLKTKSLLASKPERKLVDQMIEKMSGDIGVTYQPDLLDS